MNEDRKATPAADSAEALLQQAYSLQSPAEAAALYQAWASTYDNTMLNQLGYLTPTETASLLARYLPDKGAAILDIGCGTGLAGVELQALGFSTLDAIDYSDAMLAVARSRGIYRQLLQADLLAPLSMIADASYDAMICTGTFTHAHVGAACLPELMRILKDGACFACTVHHDVWQSAGFADRVAELDNTGTLTTLYQQPGYYFKTSAHAEGDYIIWQRQSRTGG